MKIMFVGLGLIGGSMAMALEGYPDLERYAVDGDEPTRLEALGRGVVRAAWPNADDAPVEDMDIIVICLHPEAAADFVRAQAGRIRPGALLTDVCGVKRPLFEAVGEVRERTFIYLGGHPMAGRERGGFAHATADLFRGAHYILTPDAGVPQESIRLMERLVTFMGCADVVFSDPAAHDERIAYTSQLMHVMALALCDQHLVEAHDWVADESGVPDLLPAPCAACGARTGLRFPSGWICARCEWRVGDVPEGTTFGQLCARAQKKLHAAVRAFGNAAMPVHALGCCSGAGGSEIGEALALGADCFITGEVRHHEALDALDRGCCIIEAGHFETENPVCEVLADALQKAADALQYNVTVFCLKDDPFGR